MATYLQLQDRCLDATKRAVGTDRGEIKALINDSMAEIVGRLKTYEKAVTVTLIAGTLDYDITQAPFSITDMSAIGSIQAVQVGSAVNPRLDRLTLDQLLDNRTVPSVLPVWIRYFAFRPYSSLMFDSSPNLNDQVVINYFAYPPDLVADSDIPAYVPREFHDSIAKFAIAAAVRSSRKLPNGLAIAQQYEAAKEAEMAKLNAWAATRESAGPERAQLPWSRRVVPRPDQVFPGGGY